MKHRNGPPGIGRKIYGLLGKRQRISFLLILLILAVSAVLSQLTPLSVGYLTDSVLAGQYQFVLSEGGRNLSGGQRQRIALARIFLRKPRILILDEATSALDNTLESSIQAELEAMMRQCGTTVLSIAHRLSTLRNCDEIIVMEHGQIVQRGTFEALRDTPGIFQDMERGILK